MKHTYLHLLFILLAMTACDKVNDAENYEEEELQGTWQLLSETKIENGDTTVTPASDAQRMIKIINDSHFSFLRHDVNGGKDSTALFVAGGGSYTLNGNVYTEKLEFCNFREWENHSFTFEVQIQSDTLTQQGREKVEGAGVDRVIIERYVRVTD